MEAASLPPSEIYVCERHGQKVKDSLKSDPFGSGRSFNVV